MADFAGTVHFPGFLQFGKSKDTLRFHVSLPSSTAFLQIGQIGDALSF